MKFTRVALVFALSLSSFAAFADKPVVVSCKDLLVFAENGAEPGWLRIEGSYLSIFQNPDGSNEAKYRVAKSDALQHSTVTVKTHSAEKAVELLTAFGHSDALDTFVISGAREYVVNDLDSDLSMTLLTFTSPTGEIAERLLVLGAAIGRCG